MITKYRWTANTPRSHITNQRTVEIFRDMGIEDDIIAQGTPHHLMGDTVFCTQPRRRRDRPDPHLGHPSGAREADYTLASPSLNCDLPQTLLEPILIGHAASRGSRIRFDTEYVGLVQDDDGVTVTALDRVTGARVPDPREVRDRRRRRPQPGRRADLDLPIEGQMDVAGSMNIVFHADLSHLRRRTGRASSTGCCSRAPTSAASAWASCAWCGRGTSGSIVWGYDINEPPPEVDDDDGDPDRAQPRRRRDVAGDDPVDVAVGQQQDVRDPLPRRPRVLHGRRRAPASAVERARLEHLDPGRLQPGLEARVRAARRGRRRHCSTATTRSARRSASRSCCAPTRASRSSARSSRRSGSTTPATRSVLTKRMAARADNTPEGGVAAHALREALELKNYEFNAHGVEMGQRYALGGGRRRRHAEPRVRPRPRALLPPDHVAGRAPAALLARA